MPGREARWLVEEVSGWEGPDHALHLDDPVTETAVARFDALLARRLAGEPIQYVLGHWPFRTLDLMLDERVLIPRPETEGLVDHALACLDGPGDRRRPRHRLGRDRALAGRRAPGRRGVGDRRLGRRHRRGPGQPRRHRRTRRPRRRAAGRRATGSTRCPTSCAGKVTGSSWPTRRTWRAPIRSPTRCWIGSRPARSSPVARASRRSSGSSRRRRAWLAPGGALVVEIGETQGQAVRSVARAAGFTDVAVEKDLAGRDRYLVAG